MFVNGNYVDEYEDDRLHSACAIASQLSIAGCVLIVLLFMRFQRLRKHFARLVVYLSICDFWFCISNLMGHFNEHGTGCVVQGVMSTYFGLASILWTGAIAHSLQGVIVDTAIFNEDQMEANMVKFCFGVPLILLLVMLMFVSIEPAGYWCWIDSTAVGEIFRLIMFYIPLWSCICYCTITYRRISKKMSSLLEHETNNMSGKNSKYTKKSIAEAKSQARALRRLSIFPMVLVFCWTAGSISRIIGIFFPNFSWNLLNYAVVICGSLQGFLNAILYGSTIAVREAIVDLLMDCVKWLERGVLSWKKRRYLREKRLGVRPKKGRYYSTGSRELDDIDLEVDRSLEEVSFGSLQERQRIHLRNLSSPRRLRTQSTGKLTDASALSRLAKGDIPKKPTASDLNSHAGLGMGEKPRRSNLAPEDALMEKSIPEEHDDEILVRDDKVLDHVTETPAVSNQATSIGRSPYESELEELEIISPPLLLEGNTTSVHPDKPLESGESSPLSSYMGSQPPARPYTNSYFSIPHLAIDSEMESSKAPLGPTPPPSPPTSKADLPNIKTGSEVESPVASILVTRPESTAHQRISASRPKDVAPTVVPPTISVTDPSQDAADTA